MTDIRIVQQGSPTEAVTLDFLLTPAGLLDDTQDLATAMTVALLTDRRALDTDTLPNPRDDDRRGWWADTDAAEIWDGWPIGSRLWLLARESIRPPEAREGATVARVEAYIYEAMRPFVERGIATKVVANAYRDGVERIGATVTLYRGPRDAIQLRFADLWSEIQNT